MSGAHYINSIQWNVNKVGKNCFLPASEVVATADFEQVFARTG